MSGLNSGAGVEKYVFGKLNLTIIHRGCSDGKRNKQRFNLKHFK